MYITYNLTTSHENLTIIQMHIFSYRRVAERKRAQKRTSRGVPYAKSKPAARIMEEAVELYGMGEKTISHTVSKTKVWHITTANNLAKPLWYVITSHLSHLNQHELYMNHPQVKDGEMITTYKELDGYLIPISDVRNSIAGKISSNFISSNILCFLALCNLYITILQMNLFLPCPLQRWTQNITDRDWNLTWWHQKNSDMSWFGSSPMRKDWERNRWDTGWGISNVHGTLHHGTTVSTQNTLQQSS